MKKHLLLTLALCVLPAAEPALAQSKPAPRAATGITAVAQGEPTGLRLENGTLTFCDRRGGRKLDLKTKQDSAFEKSCPNNTEPNVACANLGIDVEVRAQRTEPNDILDVSGWSVPLRGRVHDCVSNGQALAIVTASSVVLVDAPRRRTRELDRGGGDRVAIDGTWVAWSKGSRLRAVPR